LELPVPTPKNKPLHLTWMEDGGTAIKGYLTSYIVSVLNYKRKKVKKYSKSVISILHFINLSEGTERNGSRDRE